MAASRRLGYRLQTGERENTWYTIVGVVGDMKTFGLATHPEPVVYTPYEQSGSGGLRDIGLIIRSALPIDSIAPEFRRIVGELDPEQPVASIETIDERLDALVSRPRFTADLLSVFSCFGVLLAVIGVYGVLTCRTRAQVREIALRQALGAQRTAIISNVLGHGTRMVVPGLLAGVALAFVGNRLISGLLFDVKPDEPTLMMAVCAAIVLAAFTASLVPALRASRLDPLAALRQD